LCQFFSENFLIRDDTFFLGLARSSVSGELFQKKSVENNSWQKALKSKKALALCKPIAKKARYNFLF
jgi:hypothetical protein